MGRTMTQTVPATSVEVLKVPRRIRSASARVDLPTFDIVVPSPPEEVQSPRSSVDELIARLGEFLQPTPARSTRTEATEVTRTKAPSIRRPRFMWD